MIGRNGGSSRHKQHPTGRKHVRMQRKEFHIRTKQKQDCLGSNVTRMNRDHTGWKKGCSGDIQNGRKLDCSGLIEICQKEFAWSVCKPIGRLIALCRCCCLFVMKYSYHLSSFVRSQTQLPSILLSPAQVFVFCFSRPHHHPCVLEY